MFASTDQMRVRLAEELSAMYAKEVPKYDHLVNATNRINAAHGGGHLDHVRLGGERHGAIRLASFDELAQIAQLFSLYDMHAVGYYDLRTSATPIPVVSTAFRPIEAAALEASPFRMFTSTLVFDDERFFTTEVQEELADRRASRQLISPELDQLIEQAKANGGVDEADSATFVALTVDVFRLDLDPIDARWHELLDAVSPVASDIAAATGTHLNHLTPRVVDIEALHELMEAEGVTMIDRIQGPPSWAGPDLLLRQTSFRALDEERVFIAEDGTTSTRTVRVRFGEVEQRGIALTPQGRAKVDAATAAGNGATSNAERAAAIRAQLDATFAHTIGELAIDGDIFVRYAATGSPAVSGTPAELVAAGVIAVEPITYEDFLPASAAGIFASNLAHGGAQIDDTTARLGDAERLRSAVGTLHDPYELYATQQHNSLVQTLEAIGLAPDEDS